MSVPRSAVPLVGRVSELADLTASIEAAAGGRAMGLVVGGDAGVGKTRLLAELTGVAESAGFLNLVGHCVDLGDTPPPYLPFTEAFGRLQSERPDLAADLDAQFPALGRLLPARGDQRDASSTDRVERGDLFDSVRGALAHLAVTQPVALFVEDVHWADEATRDLLGYLFTRLDGERLVLVASYRSDDLHRRHPLRRTLAEWSRLPAVTRLNLDPLGADDVRSLVHAMTTGANEGPTITDADIDDIVRRADGNAFFAEELLAATLACDSGQLPWQLADLLLVRLDRLSEDARQVVRVAAVAGRRVSHTVLDAAAAMPAPALEAALREAIDSHVLQLTSSGRGYTFRHALLAEAVYDDLLPGERVRLHAAYAGVLAAEPDHRAAELARHAAASHDLPTAFQASLAAGDEAMALAAPREALQHFESALELAPRVPDLAPDLPKLILAAVEAADASGATQRGVRLAERGLAELPADASSADRATLLYASVRALMGSEFGEDVIATSAEALRLMPADPPSNLRARMLAQHGRVLLALGRDTDGERTLQDALSVAEATGSRLAITEARASLAILERRKGNPAEAAALLQAAAEQSQAIHDYGTELRTRFVLASLWHEQCELDKAEDAFVTTHRRAVETGREWDLYGVHARAMMATLQYIRGAWDDALRTLDIGTERATAVGRAILTSTGYSIRAPRGDAALLDELPGIRAYWSREGRIALYAAFGALEIHEQHGDVESALAIIDDAVTELGRLWLEPWFLGRIQLSALGVATIAAAAAQAPEGQHKALVERGRQLVSDGHRSAAEGLPNTRAMGREGKAWLARLDAEWTRLRWLTGIEAPTADELVAAWQQTLYAFDFGHALQLARARARLAEAQRATGDAAASAETAKRARAAAERLGATPLVAEIAALSSLRRASADGSGFAALTERENGVLAELVDGRTNRQIAAKLYISEKTVSVHVSNILGKLGVRSRAEAAALARRDGFQPTA